MNNQEIIKKIKEKKLTLVFDTETSGIDPRKLNGVLSICLIDNDNGDLILNAYIRPHKELLGAGFPNGDFAGAISVNHITTTYLNALEDITNCANEYINLGLFDDFFKHMDDSQIDKFFNEFSHTMSTNENLEISPITKRLIRSYLKDTVVLSKCSNEELNDIVSSNSLFDKKVYERKELAPLISLYFEAASKVIAHNGNFDINFIKLCLGVENVPELLDTCESFRQLMGAKQDKDNPYLYTYSSEDEYGNNVGNNLSDVIFKIAPHRYEKFITKDAHIVTKDTQLTHGLATMLNGYNNNNKKFNFQTTPYEDALNTLNKEIKRNNNKIKKIKSSLNYNESNESTINCDLLKKEMENISKEFNKNIKSFIDFIESSPQETLINIFDDLGFISSGEIFKTKKEKLESILTNEIDTKKKHNNVTAEQKREFYNTILELNKTQKIGLSNTQLQKIVILCCDVLDENYDKTIWTNLKNKTNSFANISTLSNKEFEALKKYINLYVSADLHKNFEEFECKGTTPKSRNENYEGKNRRLLLKASTFYNKVDEREVYFKNQLPKLCDDFVSFLNNNNKLNELLQKNNKNEFLTLDEIAFVRNLLKKDNLSPHICLDIKCNKDSIAATIIDNHTGEMEVFNTYNSPFETPFNDSKISTQKIKALEAIENYTYSMLNGNALKSYNELIESNVPILKELQFAKNILRQMGVNEEYVKHFEVLFHKNYSLAKNLIDVTTTKDGIETIKTDIEMTEKNCGIRDLQVLSIDKFNKKLFDIIETCDEITMTKNTQERLHFLSNSIGFPTNHIVENIHENQNDLDVRGLYQEWKENPNSQTCLMENKHYTTEENKTIREQIAIINLQEKEIKKLSQLITQEEFIKSRTNATNKVANKNDEGR